MPIGRAPNLGGGVGGGGVGGGSATIITDSTTIPDSQTVLWGSLTAEQQQSLIDGGLDPDSVDGSTEVEIPVVFGAGLAVCLVENVSGDEEFRLCSSHLETGSPNTFLGFQINDTSNGSAPIVVTMRGTRISDPVVTGGADLVPGGDVYLSHVAGEVTQDPVDEDGYAEIRLGFAIAADKFVLANDYRLVL